MLRFQHISYLLALGFIPLLILLFVSLLFWRRRKLGKIGDEQLVKSQVLGYIPARATTRFILLSLALAVAIIGLANLQMGDKAEKVERKGVDVMIALDVSKSMLATDIQPDRLARAKQFITRMLDKMQNDRVGLVIFAGRAYLQVPLTIDYSSVRMLLNGVSPDKIPTQGTVIGDAIDLSMRSFSQTEKKYKSLVIISDGEDHDETAMDKAKAAAEAGVIIHTVGIGSPQGTTLYDPEVKSVKLDENGNPVISRLNEEELKNLASKGRGTYSFLNNPDKTAEKIMNEIDGMEHKNLGAVVFTDYESYFQYFLVVAVLLLIAEWFLPASGKKGNAVVKGSTALLFFMLIASSSFAQEKKLLREGNKLYEQKKYKEASANYLQALKQNPNSTTGMFNLGNSLYQQKQPEKAREAMETVAKNGDKPEKAAANYNIGNTYMDQQKWEQAIDAYKQSLRNNPQDADAKYNLSYAREKLKQKQQQNKDNKDKNKDKKDQDKKDQDKKDQDKKDQDKKDQDKKDQDKKDQDKKDGKGDQDQKDKQDQGNEPQSQQPSKLSKEQADQILKALQQEEKNLQDKKQKGKGVPVKMDKDW